MNVELFDKAVEFIASRNDTQLDLSNWQHLSHSGDNPINSSEDVTCGTIACAGGWLALNKEFNELGLYPSTSIGMPCFESNRGYYALAKLFDISYTDSQTLFFFRTYQDDDLFGHHYAELMTDRQLWLSRARIIRARYVKGNKFRNKPVVVEAYTFDEVIAEGRRVAASLVNGMLWSFTFRGYTVTHERDDCYLIQLEYGSDTFTKDRVLVISPDGDYLCSKEHFGAKFERV